MEPASFADLFGRPPAVRASAPGRVNLIGDHTDYNGGFVLPAAIPQRTHVELASRHDTSVCVFSSAFSGQPVARYELGTEAPEGSWVDYVKGMTQTLASAGLSRGFEAGIESDVPVGGGLASSAALEIALGRALREAFDLPLDDLALARAGRRAENEFVGAPVGIMDQIACSLASETAAVFLDTRSLEFSHVPLPPAAALVVLDSGLPHRHAGGGYVERRRECLEAAERLRVPELRDATPDLLVACPLPERLLRRARHVITENARVLATVEALRDGDLARAGALFTESHASLRDDFEVSVPAIDFMVAAALRVPGVYGARLTGGGFGGAVVALTCRSQARQAALQLASVYLKHTGNIARVIVPPH
jgi:galactokinase